MAPIPSWWLMRARQPAWRRASARNHWSIGSSSASSPSIWRRATARAWRLAGGVVTCSSQARLARDSSSWVGRGSPWWNKAAWMRCCQAVRCRPGSCAAARWCAGPGSRWAGSRSWAAGPVPAAPAAAGRRCGRSWPGAWGRAGCWSRLARPDGDQPGRLELLDHEPPAGAALHREPAAGAGQLTQPGPHARPGRWRDATAAGLATVAIHPVEGDLGSVHVQPT